MRKISIDIETFSSVALKDSGVYAYAESPDFEILLFAYSVDDGPVRVVDIASGETLPEDVHHALSEPDIEKWAFNAQFERICLSRYLGLPGGSYLHPGAWRCTMVLAATLGLPMTLKECGKVLGLEQQKMAEGANLIRYFCVPCKPTKANGGRTRNYPCHAPDKWATFKRYNARDVEVEKDIQGLLSRIPLPEWLWEEYSMDQRINDRGVLVDRAFVRSAIGMNSIASVRALESMRRMTGLSNPNSVSQLKDWLAGYGIEADSLDKKAVETLLEDCPEEVKPVLELRSQIAKSSVKKYQATEKAACGDNRVRGMIQFYGAPRTGRFAGRIVQVQNLARNEVEDLDALRSLVQAGDYEAVEKSYGSVPYVLSQLVRTAFIPPAGMRYLVADYSAIEARVLAWLAGEEWRLELFRQGGDIYCQSASKMFGVPVVKHGENGHLRAKGKVAELACGYGGGSGALIAMGALKAGLTEEELPEIVTSWRAASPRIVNYWWDIDRAVKEAVKHGSTSTVRNIRIGKGFGLLFIQLPSGRRLAYPQPEMGINHFGKECVTFMGMDETQHWSRIPSYGPKFVENITQGVARDLLCHAMKGIPGIVMHIHDEVVVEAGPERTLEDVCRAMEAAPEWAEGLPLKAAGYECDYYQKD